MTVAMALAEKLHHSAQRPSMARAGEWGREMNFTATIQDPPTHPSRTSSACTKKSPAGRGRTERAKRRTVQQVVDFVPSLPTLDAPVPQMVEQLPDILPFFAALSPVPEQVIDVPKIVPEDVSLRTSVREPQPAEQLGEVPSIVTLSEVIR